MCLVWAPSCLISARVENRNEWTSGARTTRSLVRPHSYTTRSIVCPPLIHNSGKTSEIIVDNPFDLENLDPKP